MLYSVYGIEGDKARAKKDSLLASCKKQRPDAEIFVLDNENFSENVLENLYSSQGLFSQKHVVVISKLLTPKKKKKDEEEVEEEGAFLFNDA